MRINAAEGKSVLGKILEQATAFSVHLQCLRFLPSWAASPPVTRAILSNFELRQPQRFHFHLQKRHLAIWTQHLGLWKINNSGFQNQQRFFAKIVKCKSRAKVG